MLFEEFVMYTSCTCILQQWRICLVLLVLSFFLIRDFVYLVAYLEYSSLRFLYEILLAAMAAFMKAVRRTC